MKHSEILIIQKNTGHDAREKKKQEMKREEAIEINRENMHMLYVCMLTRIPKMLGRVGKTKMLGKIKDFQIMWANISCNENITNV